MKRLSPCVFSILLLSTVHSYAESSDQNKRFLVAALKGDVMTVKTLLDEGIDVNVTGDSHNPPWMPHVEEAMWRS